MYGILSVVVAKSVDLEVLFDKFNTHYFEGSLPSYRVKWSNQLPWTSSVYSISSKRTYGRISYEKGLILINSMLSTPAYKYQLPFTLLHEMVHLYVHTEYLGIPAGHGPLFEQAARRLFVEFNVPISYRGKLFPSPEPHINNMSRAQEWMRARYKSLLEI